MGALEEVRTERAKGESIMEIPEDKLREILAEAKRQGASEAIEEIFSSPRKIKEVRKSFSRSFMQLRATPFMEAFMEVVGVDLHKHGEITRMLTDALELGLELASKRELRPSGNRRFVARIDSGLHERAVASGWTFQDLIVLGELFRLSTILQAEEAGDGDL